MEYHPASLIKRGKNFYVQITIPDEIRSEFKGQKQIQKSTKTSDARIAERRKHIIASEVYADFDACQSKPKLNLAKKLQILAGISDTFNESDWQGKSSENSAKQLVKSASNRLATLTDIAQSPLKVKPKIKLMVANATPANPHSDDNLPLQKAIKDKRLLRRQAYNEKHGIEKGDGTISLTPNHEKIVELEKTLAEFKQAYLPIETFGHKISELAEEYFNQRDFNRQKTGSSKRKSINRFIEFAGDLRINEVNKVLANQFFISLTKTKANGTLIKDRSSLKLTFEFAEEMGWIEDNPFGNINLRNKGKKSIETVTFTKAQLEKLFQLDIPEKHRLCLTLLAGTGARLDEIALLNWSDIQTDCETGIVYLDLTDPNSPRKNMRSRRKIPLPPSISLPQRGEGRLFDYRIDPDGKAQNAASKALMRFVKKVRVSNERLVVHSLRHTYKDMLRAIEAPEDIANSIMGHTPSNEGGKYGSGHNLKTMLKYMNQIDLSFSNPKE